MQEGIGWWAEGEEEGTTTVIGAATSVKSFKAQTTDSQNTVCSEFKNKKHILKI